MSSLRHDLHRALREGEPMTGLVALLQDFRDQGGTREAARDTLESLRPALHGHQEERALELLDRVTGFCSPGDRIWPDPVQL